MPTAAVHFVIGHLADGPVSQRCETADEAAALFDRLRIRAPMVRFERTADGRVIEIANAATHR